MKRLLLLVAACGSAPHYHEAPRPEGVAVTAKPLGCPGQPFGVGAVISTPDALANIAPECTTPVDFTRQVVVSVTAGDTNSASITVGSFQRHGEIVNVELDIYPHCSGGMNRGEGHEMLYVVDAVGVTRVETFNHLAGRPARDCPRNVP